MPKYEIALFNQNVRDLVKQGEAHELYEDSWADTHYVDVVAPSEAMARAKIDKQYPQSRGFVIEQINEEMADGEF